jgi:hypothetical protein
MRNQSRVVGAHEQFSTAVDRRTFLKASGLSCGTLAASAITTGGLLQSAEYGATGRPNAAKSAILIFLSGGASHIDTWDMKPDAPLEYRGEFNEVPTTAPEIRMCEHLPLLGKQAQHLAIVRSLGHYGRGTGDHHAGYYYNLTGRAPDPTFRQLLNNRQPQPSDWPYIGSVVGWKKPAHAYLPQSISLPQMPGFPAYTRPGQFAAKLGVEHDPLYVYGKYDSPLEFTVPSLSLSGEVTTGRLAARKQLLGALDTAQRRFEAAPQPVAFSKHQQRAFSLLTSSKAKEAFAIEQEPQPLRDSYGPTINGTSMLMARRLVEAGVPFVSVFWYEDQKIADKCKSAGGWDTHASNFACLRDHLLPEFDRAYSALLADLHERGMLDDTLVMVTSEMGRTPKVGDRRSGGVAGAGRDHWVECMSVLLAGGGVRGGQVYGTSDRVAAYPDKNPVAPEDIAKTVYHSLGIDDIRPVGKEDRPLPILEEGNPIKALF